MNTLYNYLFIRLFSIVLGFQICYIFRDIAILCSVLQKIVDGRVT